VTVTSSVSSASTYCALYGWRVPRPRYPAKSETPPPLAPEERTVGQLVGEAIRLYAAHWRRAIAIGIPPAIFGVAAAEVGGWDAVALSAGVGSLVFTASYLVACGLVGGVDLRTRQTAIAFAAGVLVFVPAPFLGTLFILPALAWLALVGLVVPVALIERTSFRQSFSRAVELARVDYVHVLGSLATLAILSVLCQGVVAFALREFSEQTERIAAALAGIVLTPLLFLGAAILYVDQEARWRVRVAGTAKGWKRAK
jgi:hypothetical protein